MRGPGRPPRTPSGVPDGLHTGRAALFQFRISYPSKLEN